MSFGTYERRPHSMAEGRNKPRDLDPVGTNEIDLGDSSNADKDSGLNADRDSGLGFLLKKFEEGWKTLTSSWDKIWQTPDALKGNDVPGALWSTSVGTGIINGLGDYKLPEINKPHVPEFHATTHPDGTWELSNKGSPYVVTGKTKLNSKDRVFRDPEWVNCLFTPLNLPINLFQEENPSFLYQL